MKILIITQNYIPEPDPKMHILAKGLVMRGHEAVVLTGFPNYPQGKIYPGWRQKIWQKEIVDGVKIIRVPLFPNRGRSAFLRAINYLSFPLAASILGPFLCGRTDVIMAYHPPITLGIPALILSKIKKAPFVFEIQDMWPETLSATGMVSNRLTLGVVARLARFIYKKAAAITVISPGFGENLRQKGVDPQKIKVFYNWAYEGEFLPVAADSQLAEKWGMAGRFNVLYAGNMGPAQGLLNVIAAAALLKSISKIQFVFVGGGIDKKMLETAAAEKKLANVRFLPRIPMADMPKLYALSEAVLVHLVDNPLFKITIPGKTQSSLLSGRPVIISVAGDAADLILSAKAGLAATPMNAASLARVVKKLYDMKDDERKKIGAAGRDYYFKYLCPQVQIEKYEELFDLILKTKNKDAD